MIRSLPAVALLLPLLIATPARAHCDTTRGPVVTDARAALQAGDVDLVLHWVRPEDEPAIRNAFAQTLAVRAGGPQARELADRYFFETLVRIHRAGEGAPYTGLRDEDPEPIILETDRALDSGSATTLEGELVETVRGGLAERFEAARETKGFAPGDVTAGRAYVARYVTLTHWVEGVFSTASGSMEHHEAGAHESGEHAAAAGPDDHVEPEATTGAHGAVLTPLPWMLAGVLALVALVEGALLMRRRRTASQ